jgi:hypothetical protein
MLILPPNARLKRGLAVGPMAYACVSNGSNPRPTGDIQDLVGRNTFSRAGGNTWGFDPQVGRINTLDGSTGYLATTLNLPTGLSSATLSFRAKASSTSIAQPLHGVGGGSLNSYITFSDGNIYLAFFDGSSRPINGYTPTGIDLTQWHDFDLISSPGSNGYMFFIDGVLRASATRGTFSLASTLSLFTTSNNEFYTGAYQNVMLFPFALTPTLVAAKYARGLNLLVNPNADPHEQIFALPIAASSPKHYLPLLGCGA